MVAVALQLRAASTLSPDGRLPVGNSVGRASPGELLQFNLSQPVASVVIGCEQLAPLEQNVQAALNFTPISESGRQRLQEKVAPSRSAWENFLRTHEDTVPV